MRYLIKFISSPNRPWIGKVGAAALLLMQALAIVQPSRASAPQPLVSAEALKRILFEPGAPILGSATADVIVVEYFDYNCPICKALAPAFPPFIDNDHQSAVLYKEWPVFGGVSIYAAQSALAAGFQGKYLQAHDALINAPRLADNSQVDSALANAGIDLVRLKADLVARRASIDGLLARNDLEARGMGLHGTPGILVDRRIVSGISDLKSLQSAVALARRASRQTNRSIAAERQRRLALSTH
jgi:protein-disulfide isomerase